MATAFDAPRARQLQGDHFTGTVKNDLQRNSRQSGEPQSAWVQHERQPASFRRISVLAAAASEANDSTKL